MLHNVGVIASIPFRVRSLVLVCLLLSACQRPSDDEAPGEAVTYRFQNRDAWKLENDRLRVSILEGGGHIAEIVLKTAAGESVSPLWVPPWPSIDPSTFDADKHSTIYGSNSEASLLAGIMGHNLCFNFWGAPSEAEFRAGMSFHGEVSILKAQKLTQTGTELTHRLDLARSGTTITRTLRLLPNQPVLYVEETAENLSSLDKPFGWVQHPTFGPPFVNPETVVFDASATQGDLGGEKDYESLGTWPVGSPGEGQKDYRRFSPETPSYKMAYFLLDRTRDLEFITALNTEHRLLVGYVFWRADYPWMMVWEENRRLQTPPWNGETVTRGMEFGNTRIPGSAKEYFKKPEMYGTPTFGWLEAKGQLKARFLVFLTEVPEGMTGVRDIRLEGSEIVVEPKGVQEALRIAHDPDLFLRP
ncbi:MAG: hypothetical protein CMJ81_14685 [Planctomycetaceae bacterium]|nr:hypothetical protein [Planctomycetaceae bacterium]